jgi:hypothetical protein
MAGSSHNRVRLNTFQGNGAATSKSSATATNGNNFGLGLLGVSQNNLVENNKIGGNINGVYLGGGGQVIGNIIRRNMIAGNPPAQVSNTFGSAIGADIQDLSPAGANTFDGNYCLTYAGTGPSPCPNISEPEHQGHQEHEELRGALKPTNLGSLFDDLWALLGPSGAQRNALPQSRRIGDAASNRSLKQ